MKRSGKLIKIIVVVLLLNLGCGDLAMAAQGTFPTATPTTPTATTVTKADWQLAQGGDKAACDVFSQKVSDVTGKQFKAGYSVTTVKGSRGSFVTNKCDVIPADYPIKADGTIDRTTIQQPAKNLQDTIINSSTGLTQNTWTASVTQNQNQQTEAANIFSQGFGWILNEVAAIINSFITLITALAGKILASVIDATTGFTQMPLIVNIGWGVVRDIANMFFILIMIVIAIAAILRIEAYDYRHLLVEVIIMAILVNFSEVIAVALINFSNLLVNIFVIKGSYASMYATMHAIVDPQGIIQSLPTGGASSALVQSLTSIALNIIMAVSFIALAALFVVRMVGLYVLVIISPAAYVLDILPVTKNLAHQWWHKFTEYLIWAPVAMFFIRLTSLITQNGGTQDVLNNGGDSAFKFIILAAFIWAAILVAEHAGMVGGAAITGAAEKALHGIGHGALGLVGRTYSKNMNKAADKAEKAGNTGRATVYKALAFLNPIVAKKAWEQRSHHLDEEAYGPAVGAAHDTLNRVMPTEWHGWKDLVTGKGGLTLGRKTNYGAIEHNRIINQKTKEFNETPLTEEQRVKLYNDATHLDDKLALLRSIVLNRHEDGLAASWGVAYDSTDFKQKIFDDLQHAGASKEQIGEQMNFISEISEEGRKIRGMGAGVVDKDGVARASVDLTGVEQMGEKNGTELVQYLKDLNVIDGQGNFVDRFGGVVKDASGQNVVINNYVDYQNAIKNTINNDKTKGEVFENEVKAARAAKETIKRLKRTDSEDVAKALEPAAVATQGLDGKYKHLHSEGARILARLNPTVGAAVPGMRRTAARFQALVGGSEDEHGNINYKDILTDPEKFDILVETSHEAPEVAAGFLSKAKMDDATKLQLKTLVNTALRTRYKGVKAATRFLDYDAAKPGTDWVAK